MLGNSSKTGPCLDIFNLMLPAVKLLTETSSPNLYLSKKNLFKDCFVFTKPICCGDIDAAS